ncbi:glycosyltransferase family 2 protein [Candidatus Kaiserbacteria bacterium]|nr:glycosyltransferase family 2 protein [Candidatus Kaiserbacteria bacterium]
MNAPDKIPCTVAILTRNNAATVPRCLDSVRDFAEIIVCDGGSTDGTLEIARAAGARILNQDKAHQDDQGRIIDFAGVRNQTLAAASYDWFFYLDSDEYIDSGLVEEIRNIIASSAIGAYFVPRLYVVDGAIVRCASTYPNQQMRFFSRTVATQFKKSIHERIELAPGIVPKRLVHAMYVPLSPDATELRAKWRRYLSLEDARRAPLTLRAWFSLALHETLVAALYAGRTLRALLWCRGKRMPLAIERARLWYQYEVIRRALSSVNRW